MFKTLIKAFIENRFNAIDKEIEEIASEMVEDEDNTIAKGKIATITHEVNPSNVKRFRKLKMRIMLYSLLFGELKC